MSVLLLILLLLLVAINGFFVAAEFAIVRSRRSRLEQLREEGDRRAGPALNQIDNVDQYVATSQVGITLASLGIGFLGEPALATLLEPLFGEFFSHAVAVGIAIAVAFTIVTFLHVILGEQAPKMLAIGKAEGVLLWIAGPMAFFRRLLHPLIIATNAPANFLVRRVLKVDVDEGEETSPEEL
ncbi:MAG TPA: CNNM domain-containing protein, partial [Solirubrobacterales bacterium]|nr:CNNM domain-containing protein [Solirubrobacterales bacterium]